MHVRLALALALIASAASASPTGGTGAPGGAGRAFHVGPGQQYVNLGDVPWYRLGAGDTVYVHHRDTPYREKILISGRGTPAQWIRVLGVPGPKGELPVISGDGATTSTNMHYRWQDASGNRAIQWSGVIQIATRAEDGGPPPPLPGYIEIANLRVQDGFSSYRFTAENGTTSKYDSFAACIYARSVQHLLVRDNVLTNCGQGFFNWTGDGSQEVWWTGLQVDTILRGNHFFGNGNPGSWTEHQVYTESDGVVLEYNRFGPQRPGALGSQIKDRSAGTIIRYNYIEQALAGWDIDLVEPEEGWTTLGSRASYKQAFVYGNVIFNGSIHSPNLIHWNEDHQVGRGRATLAGGKLFFYGNTLLTIANEKDMRGFAVFNVTWGGYECPGGKLQGVIDVRNNVFAVLPRTPGSAIPKLVFGYCGQENFAFGKNWVSPGYVVHGANVSGADNLISPRANDPGFVSASTGDVRLAAGSSAAGQGGPLAPEVGANSLSVDLTPRFQYVYDQQVAPRAASGAGSDLGAFQR